MPKTFQLGRPELSEEVEALLKKGGSARQMERLMALRLGLSGEHTLEEIGEIVGRSRSRIIEWMRLAREEGVGALLGIHQGRGRSARVSGKIFSELRQGVRRGRWKRAKETQAWLAERHGIKLSVPGMRYWLKKAGES